MSDCPTVLAVNGVVVAGNFSSRVHAIPHDEITIVALALCRGSAEIGLIVEYDWSARWITRRNSFRGGWGVGLTPENQGLCCIVALQQVIGEAIEAVTNLEVVLAPPQWFRPWNQFP